MAQFLRPSSDVSIGGWTDLGGGTTNLYINIDEAAADLGDQVRSVLAPVADACEFGLSAATDPVSSTGHTVRYRGRKTPSASMQVDLTAELLEGATVRATWLVENMPDTYTTWTQLLTG